MSVHVKDELLDEVVDGEVIAEEQPSYAMVPVLPRTGEAISLKDASAGELAQMLDLLRQFETNDLRDFKRAIQEEFIDRMDAHVEAGAANSWTWHTSDGWTIQADTPDRTDWDVAELRGLLGRLVEDGKLDAAWVEKIIVPAGWKVAKRPLATLLKLGGEVAAAVREVERPAGRRSVTVKRS